MATLIHHAHAADGADLTIQSGDRVVIYHIPHEPSEAEIADALETVDAETWALIDEQLGIPEAG